MQDCSTPFSEFVLNYKLYSTSHATEKELCHVIYEIRDCNAEIIITLPINKAIFDEKPESIIFKVFFFL